jgi:hypothetical protein
MAENIRTCGTDRTGRAWEVRRTGRLIELTIGDDRTTVRPGGWDHDVTAAVPRVYEALVSVLRAASEPLPIPVGPVAPAGSRLVVIPCGGRKRAQRTPAGAMYTGSYHLACRRAAAWLTRDGGTVIILSAKYGFLRMGDPIDPYDLKMGQRGSVSVAILREQAARLGLSRIRDVTVLGGRAYADAASAVWPDARRPLDGTTSMGEQLARLAAIAEGRS